MYLDNWDNMRRRLQSEVRSQLGSTGESQAAFRQVLDRWVIIRAPHKAAEGVQRHQTLGAIFDGRQGRAFPSGAKIAKFVGLIWFLASQKWIPYQYVMAAWGPHLLHAAVQAAAIRPPRLALVCGAR